MRSAFQVDKSTSSGEQTYSAQGITHWTAQQDRNGEKQQQDTGQ